MRHLRVLIRPLALFAVLFAVLLATAAVPGRAFDGFVGCSTSDDCWPFDLATHEVRPALPLMGLGDYPYDATVTPDGYEVWFVGASGDGVVVYSRTSGALVALIPVADYVIGVAFASDGSRAFVSSRDEESLSIIDTATYAVTGTLPLPIDGGNLALDPTSGNLYVLDWYGPTLCEVAPDGSAVLRQADLGSSLWQVVVAPDGEHVYVTDRGTDEVLEVERATLAVTRRFAVGDDPWGLDITADGSLLVVTCEDDAEVQLIDRATGTVTSIALDATADPRDVDILDQAGLAYVAGGTATGYQSPLYVIDLQAGSVVETLDGPGTNANVVAVQTQMHATPAGADTPDATMALSAFPNPFNPRVTVSWRLPGPTRGDVAVYDLAGRHLRTLAQGALPAGPQRVSWDGRDEAGRDLAAGTYLVTMRAGAQTRTCKVVLAR